METETLKVAKSITNLESLERLKGGSCRTVYRDNDKVIKVARNPKGLEQNILANDYLLINDGILPNLIDVGLDYIITEYIPRNDKVTRQFLKPLKKFTPIDFKNKISELQEALRDMEIDIIMNYDVLWNDFVSYRNWGVRENGNCVLIDEGAMSDQIHYMSKPTEWAVTDWEEVKRLRRIN